MYFRGGLVRSHRSHPIEAITDEVKFAWILTVRHSEASMSAPGGALLEQT